MTESRRHVLVWVAAEFLESAGMVRILEEAGLLSVKSSDVDEMVESIEEAGGLALTGRLVESQHGAGIWISPEESLGIEILIPWHFVRSVITAEPAKSAKMFGLLTDIAANSSIPKKNA